jgi:hypothetical protein
MSLDCSYIWWHTCSEAFCNRCNIFQVAVCNLASIAVNMFVRPDKTYDFARLKEVSKIVARNLNKIIDINYYPVPEVCWVIQVAWITYILIEKLSESLTWLYKGGIFVKHSVKQNYLQYKHLRWRNIQCLWSRLLQRLKVTHSRNSPHFMDWERTFTRACHWSLNLSVMNLIHTLTLCFITLFLQYLCWLFLGTLSRQPFLSQVR